MFVLCAIISFITESRIPFIARSLTVVLLLLAASGVYWALKKKKTSRPRGTKCLFGSTVQRKLYFPCCFLIF